MSKLPIEFPEFYRPVKAIIKHFDKWKFKDVILIVRNETDCDYRFFGDNSQLAYEWNVIYWEYVDE